jgi:manganese transport protein
VVTLIGTIAACFAYEIFFARPLWLEAVHGFVPHLEILRNKEMLYIAIGIIGATVMPHNLYLHSSIVQTRAFGQSTQERREAIKYAIIDSTVALTFALFINAAILVLGAAAFHTRGLNEVADISQAYKLLSPVLGASLGSTLFAFALLASGQNSTLTGTLAGQIVMEGFLQIRLKPWIRRLVTRMIAILPAVLVIGIAGEGKLTALLILSQVVLSFQLPFAVIPLVRFTSERADVPSAALPPHARFVRRFCLGHEREIATEPEDAQNPFCLHHHPDFSIDWFCRVPEDSLDRASGRKGAQESADHFRREYHRCKADLHRSLRQLSRRHR